MPTLCEKCHLRESCTSLCETAEQYADQDRVPQRRNVIVLTDIKLNQKDIPSSLYLTTKEKEIVFLLSRGLHRQDICRLLNISKNALRCHIKNMRRKIKDLQT